jgi:hypothetical protein
MTNKLHQIQLVGFPFTKHNTKTKLDTLLPTPQNKPTSINTTSTTKELVREWEWNLGIGVA